MNSNEIASFCATRQTLSLTAYFWAQSSCPPKQKYPVYGNAVDESISQNVLRTVKKDGDL